VPGGRTTIYGATPAARRETDLELLWPWIWAAMGSKRDFRDLGLAPRITEPEKLPICG